MRRESLRLPADHECGTVFRQYVRLACHQCRRDALLDRVLLVTDELVTNAVKHAHNDGERFVEVAVIPTQRGIRVEVTDGDPTPPRVLEAQPEATAGRGMRVVSTLASDWGCTQASHGKTVWADVEATESAGSAAFAGWPAGRGSGRLADRLPTQPGRSTQR